MKTVASQAAGLFEGRDERRFSHIARGAHRVIERFRSFKPPERKLITT
jgi:hypothetical protein